MADCLQYIAAYRKCWPGITDEAQAGVFRFCHVTIARVIVVAFLIAVSGGNALSKQGVPQDIERIKDATVFIRAGDSEGSGFLFERQNDHGYIATAAHVVENLAVGEKPSVYVFAGTKSQLELQADVIGLDVAGDIGFLKVHSTLLPRPLYLAPEAAVRETMDILAAGYPFGSQIAVASAIPNVSLARGAVSSVRRGASDDLVMIQIDANVNPGNSGGPVLNSQSKVIGLVSAKMDGTSLGFVIPTATVLNAWMGDYSSLSGIKVENQRGETHRLVVKLIDPLNRIERATVSFCSVLSIPSQDLSGKYSWPKLPHVSTVELRGAGIERSAGIVFPVEGIRPEETAAQITCFRIDGTVSYSPPFKVTMVMESVRDPFVRDSEPRGRAPGRPPEVESLTRVTKLEASEIRQPNIIGGLPAPADSMLSSIYKVPGAMVRRLMIEHDAPYESLRWTPAGDQLILFGGNYAKINYPDCDKYDVLSGWKSSKLVGECKAGWVMQAANHWQVLSRKTLRKIEEYEILSAPPFMGAKTLDSAFVSAVRTGVLYMQPFLISTGQLGPILTVPANENEGPVDAYRISSDGDYLYTLHPEHFGCYRLGNSEIKRIYSENIAGKLRANSMLAVEGSGYVAVIEQPGAPEYRKDSKILFVSHQAHAQPIFGNLTGRLHCAVYDKDRKRFFIGGNEGIWILDQGTNDVQLVSFATLASVRCLQLHPDGRVLAALCHDHEENVSVYWFAIE